MLHDKKLLLHDKKMTFGNKKLLLHDKILILHEKILAFKDKKLVFNDKRTIIALHYKRKPLHFAYCKISQRKFNFYLTIYRQYFTAVFYQYYPHHKEYESFLGFYQKRVLACLA